MSYPSGDHRQQPRPAESGISYQRASDDDDAATPRGAGEGPPSTPRGKRTNTASESFVLLHFFMCLLASLDEIRLIAAFRPYNPTYLLVGRFLRANFAPLFLFCWKIVSCLSDFVRYRWSYRDTDNGQGN